MESLAQEQFEVTTQLVDTKSLTDREHNAAAFILESSIEREISIPQNEIDNQLDILDKVPFDTMCPWLNVEEASACMNEVNIENIELYLECSDDGENCEFSKVMKSHNSFGVDQEGTSMIKSDVQLKISFPNYPEEREKGFKCCSCKKEFMLEFSLKDHISRYHMNQVLVCQLCTYNTKSKKFFHNHVNSKHKNVLQNVEDLDTVISLETSSDKVVNILDTEQCVLQLPSLGERSTVNLLGTEQGLHNQESREMYNSEINTRYKQSNKKQDDMNQESNTKFMCTFCEFVTGSQKLLKSHLRNMHEVKRAKFTCSVCGFVCFQKRTFDDHETVHSGVYKYRCEICKKQFPSKSCHTRHVKTHTVRREYICDFEHCKKQFKHKGALTDHRKKVHKMQNIPHTSKAFVCHLCMIRTTSKQLFRDHMIREHKDVSNSTDDALAAAEQETPFNERVTVYLIGVNEELSSDGVVDESTYSRSESQTNELDAHVSAEIMQPERNSAQPNNQRIWETSFTDDISDNSVMQQKVNLTHRAHTVDVTDCLDDVRFNGRQMVLSHSMLDGMSKMLSITKDTEQTVTHLACSKTVEEHPLTVGTQTNEHTTQQRSEKNKPIWSKLSTKDKGHLVNVKKYPCPIEGCMKTFRDNFNLKNHLCTHNRTKGLHCNLCGFKCIQKSSLSHHFKSKHSSVRA